MEKMWEILGIAPTKDMAVIKRAYAKQVRIFRPDDNPEGFQVLRDAFDKAVLYVSNIEPVSHELKIDEKCIASKSSNEGFCESVESETSSDVIDFMRKVERLYADFNPRIQPELWRELFDDVTIWNIESREKCKAHFFAFLHEYHYYPYEVWIRIAEYLNLEENSKKNDTFGLGGLYEYIRIQVSPGLPIEYENHTEQTPSQRNQTLMAKEDVFFSIYKKQYTKARDLLDSDELKNDPDADILFLKGLLNLRMGYSKIAYSLFEDSINKSKQVNKRKIYLGEILLNKNPIKALQYANEVLDANPESFKALVLQGRSLNRQRKNNEALDIFCELHARDSKNAVLIRQMNLMYNMCIKRAAANPFNQKPKELMSRIEPYLHNVNIMPERMPKPVIFDFVCKVAILTLISYLIVLVSGNDYEQIFIYFGVLISGMVVFQWNKGRFNWEIEDCE